MKTKERNAAKGNAVTRLLLPALALSGLLLGTPTSAQKAPDSVPGPAVGRVKVTSAADLPTHTYAITSKARPLAEDPVVVSALAAAVSADITADLAKYDIADRTTLRGLYITLVDAALLREDFAAVRQDIGIIKGLEDKPADQATATLFAGMMTDALQSPGADFHQTLRADVERAYKAVPYAQVQDDLKREKQGMEIISRDLYLGASGDAADPAVTGGCIDQHQAQKLLGAALVLRYIIPNKSDLAAAYSAVLNAGRAVPKPDIWAARDVTLAPSAKLTPVVVGVWDLGTDISLYRSQLISGSPGIAYDSQARPTAGLLYPLPGGAAAAAATQAEMKVFSDFQAGIDSPEAAAFKTKVAGMTADQIHDFDEGLIQFGGYIHGTHIAGIALRGNPAARLLVCRITSAAPPSSVAQAERDADIYRKSITYFKARGVRVVNMSWGVGLSDIEAALLQTGVGGTPAARRALAKKIYDIGFRGISDAVHSAPGILFVTAAGNEHEDILFNDSYPAGVKAPNLLVVGAVDRSGEETSFTSFGSVDVYANGVDIPSFVPGGAVLKLSGTSMAAPQVTNLAAKILAVRPGLTPAQVKAAILGHADRRAGGSRTILLINPRRTLAALGAAKTGTR